MKTIFEAFGKLLDLCAGIILKLYPMASTDNETVIHIIPSPTPVLEENTAPQRVYSVAYKNLGKHLTLNTAVSPEVGCAQSVSWVLLKAGYKLPEGGISTVAGLTDWMIKQGFKEASGFALGNIIVGRNPSEAHIGVCGKEWIMSNTSFDVAFLGLHAGKFEANYHLRGWTKVFPSTRFFTPC